MNVNLNLSKEMKDELKELIRESLKQEFEKVLVRKNGNPVDESKMLNRKEACKLLGCSSTTLWNYQRKGLIPFHKVGKKVLFNRSELLNHLKVKTE